MLCSYGCGQEATHQFKNGKWCCSEYHSQCPVIINQTKYSNKPTKLHLIRKLIRILRYKNKPYLCEYGCGKPAKYFFKTNYKWCCSEFLTE